MTYSILQEEIELLIKRKSEYRPDPLVTWSEDKERINREVLPSLREELGPRILYRDQDAIKVFRQKHKSSVDALRTRNKPGYKS